MNTLLNEQLQWIVIGMAVMLIMLLVMMMRQASKLKKLRRSYTEMMASTGIDDLENIIIAMQNKIDELQESQESHSQNLKGIHTRLRKMKSKIAIQRYNAFNDHGSDLSFSMAILDEEQDGVVVTALHSRDNSYVYAKPIEQGASRYSLSPEEQEVIVLTGQKE